MSTAQTLPEMYITQMMVDFIVSVQFDDCQQRHSTLVAGVCSIPLGFMLRAAANILCKY